MLDELRANTWDSKMLNLRGMKARMEVQFNLEGFLIAFRDFQYNLYANVNRNLDANTMF